MGESGRHLKDLQVSPSPRPSFLGRFASAHLPLRFSCARPAFRWTGSAPPRFAGRGKEGADTTPEHHSQSNHPAVQVRARRPERRRRLLHTHPRTTCRMHHSSPRQRPTRRTGLHTHRTADSARSLRPHPNRTPCPERRSRVAPHHPDHTTGRRRENTRRVHPPNHTQRADNPGPRSHCANRTRCRSTRNHSAATNRSRTPTQRHPHTAPQRRPRTARSTPGLALPPAASPTPRRHRRADPTSCLHSSPHPHSPAPPPA